MVRGCRKNKQPQIAIDVRTLGLYIFVFLSLIRASSSFQTGLWNSFSQSLNWYSKPLFSSELEDDEFRIYQNSESGESGKNTPYRRKRKLKGKWGLEFERLKHVGIQARREYRKKTRIENMSGKAEAMAYAYLAKDGGNRIHKKLTQKKLRKVVECFQRLLEELQLLDEKAYNSGKEKARKRQAEIASGNATDIHTYVQELQNLRLFQQKKRAFLKERVFGSEIVDDDIDYMDTEELISILKVRGNIQNFQENDDRELIKKLVRESFATPLF